MIFLIPLRNKYGEIISNSKVDEDDYNRINVYKWSIDGNGYARCRKGLLHRFIMKAAKDDQIVNHLNNDRLDNRKENLRFATSSQNNQNRNKKKECTSIYIGVCKSRNKWSCMINVNYKKIRNYFVSEIHAAYWYDMLALKYFGIDAKINGVEKPTDFTEPVEFKKILPIGITVKNNKYRARINGVHLGLFETLEEAHKIYNNKKDEINKQKENERLCKEILRNNDGIAIIITSDKKEILVDDDKYHKLIKYSWSTKLNYSYALVDNKKTQIHRFLMNAKKGEIIDHINNNPLDNRLINLRHSTYSQNNHNKLKKSNATSKYIGVCYNIDRNKYSASIRKDNILYNLGRFETEKEAAEVRDKKAIELFGDYAKLNFK